MPAVHQTR